MASAKIAREWNVPCSILGAPVLLVDAKYYSEWSGTYCPSSNGGPCISAIIPEGTDPVATLFVLFHEVAHRRQDLAEFLDLKAYRSQLAPSPPDGLWGRTVKFLRRQKPGLFVGHRELSAYGRRTEIAANKFAVRRLLALGISPNRIRQALAGRCGEFMEWSE